MVSGQLRCEFYNKKICNLMRFIEMFFIIYNKQRWKHIYLILTICTKHWGH